MQGKLMIEKTKMEVPVESKKHDHRYDIVILTFPPSKNDENMRLHIHHTGHGVPTACRGARRTGHITDSKAMMMTDLPVILIFIFWGARIWTPRERRTDR